VGFFGPRPHGPRPRTVGWSKLTPLIKTFKKIQNVEENKIEEKKTK